MEIAFQQKKMYVMMLSLVNNDDFILLDMVSSCKLKKEGTIVSNFDSFGRSIYEWKKRKILDKVKDVVELNDSFSILSLVNWGRSISFLDSWILLWKTSWLAFKKECLPILTSSNWGRSKYIEITSKYLRE